MHKCQEKTNPCEVWTRNGQKKHTVTRQNAANDLAWQKQAVQSLQLEFLMEMNLAEVHSTSELAEFRFESCFGHLGVAGALAIEDVELCDTWPKCQQIQRPSRGPILPNRMTE